MIKAQEFLDIIFADVTDDEVVCVTKASDKDGKTLFWNVPDDDPAFTRWRPERQAQAWYFCVSTVSGERNEKGTALRRRGVDFVRYHCLVLDDIGTKATPPPVEPTWIIETSKANFQYGYALEPGEDGEQYEALVQWCHEQGWGDKGAGGAMRVMRLPGSANLKPGRGDFRSVVTECSPDAYWTLAELAAQLGCDLGALPLKTKRRGLTGGALAQKNIDPVLGWLADRSLVIDDTGGDWVDVVCPWHAEHTDGSTGAGYSPLGRGAEDWVQTRAFKCMHAHCKDRGLKEFRGWVSKHDGPWAAGYDPLPWLQSRYAYVGMGQQVVDLEQRVRGGDWVWELGDWAKMHPGRVHVAGAEKPVPVSSAFVSSRETIKADTTIYTPVKLADDVGVVELNGQKLINTYVPPNWTETGLADLPLMFLEHMEYLLPSAFERELFVDWLACKIQEPALRSYAMCMVADDVYGTGRSWLRSILSKMLGGMVNSVSLGQLIGKGTAAEANYNDWVSGCQFLVVEEAKDEIDRDVFYAGYEKFKQLVDTSVGEARVNPKFGRTRLEKIYFNCLIFTNHADALALPSGCRRVCVLKNAPKLNTPAYYDRLADSLGQGEPRRLYWFLMRRDVSKYDRIYPPMTDAKRGMIEQNASPSEQIVGWIEDNIVENLVTRDGLKGCVVAASMALGYDNIMLKPGGVTRMIWGRYGNLRGVQNGARYTINGQQLEIRALRDFEKWKKIDDARDLISMEKYLKRN